MHVILPKVCNSQQAYQHLIIQRNGLTIYLLYSFVRVGFQLNGTPSSIVSGSFASKFDWTIAPFAASCLVGTQNQTINGSTSGTIILNVNVPSNISTGTQLAVNVNMQVLGYMIQQNIQSDDNANFLLPPLTGSHYLKINQRNTIETWSTNPAAIPNSPQPYPLQIYDFTTSSMQAFGANQVYLDGNVWGFYSVDINKMVV